MKKNVRLGAVILCLALTALSCAKIPKGVVAIKPFDKQKYLGKWYEIARFDYAFERNMNNVTADYSLRDDGLICVKNRGYNYKKKTWKEADGKAKPAGKPDEGRLKVSFFGPFYAGYNVIAIDADYKYAMVAGKNRKYLWLLSRESTMPEEIKQRYLKQAKEIGYETSKLIWVEHNKK